MGKKDHLPLENLDLNSNVGNMEECFLYDLIDIALQSGKMVFFGISYTVTPSPVCPSDFVVRNHRRFQVFLRILHTAFSLFILVPFVTESLVLSECCLVNFIKKGLITVLFCCLIVAFRCMEINGRKMNDGLTGIYRQCAILHKKFNAHGLHFPTRSKVRAFGWATVLGSCTICIIRQYIFATKHNPWYTRFARQFSRTISFGFWVTSNETTPASFELVLGTFGLILDGLLANYWIFVQVFHFFLVVTMWLVFDKLNNAMKSGHFQVKHLAEVVDLHFQSTKLLKLINQLVSSLTFWSIVYDVVGVCFWTNYIANDRAIRPIYIVAVCVLLKTSVEIILAAEVNSKAHEISEWLEDACAISEKFPPIDAMKFTIFTAQIYSKECTGFKGLRFFVVTPSLAIAIGGIVVTYTVAVSQLCRT